MTIRNFLDASAERFADRPAQRFHQGGQWVTRPYSALKDRVIRLAAVRNEHRIVRQRQPSAGLAIGHIDIFVHDGTLFIGFEAASLRADAAFFRIRQNIN